MCRESVAISVTESRLTHLTPSCGRFAKLHLVTCGTFIKFATSTAWIHAIEGFQAGQVGNPQQAVV